MSPGRLLGTAVFTVLGVLCAAPVFAADNRADIERAETYLNAVTTMKAHFMQVAPDGSTQEGTAYLSRPGRMRLEYDPPSPILVVANGSYLIYFDKQLKQTSYIGLDSTPAGILLQPQVKLDSGDIKVVKIARRPGIVEIALMSKKNADQGQITLVFTEGPYKLRQWQITDPQGQVTTVSLFDAESGLPLNKELFHFVDPNFADGSPTGSGQ